MEPEVVQVKRRGRKKKRLDVENVVMEGELKRRAVEIRPKALVGLYVKKEFDRRGVFLGKVVHYNRGLYRIDYEDGDFEELESGELRKFILADDDFEAELLVKKEKLDELISKKENDITTGNAANLVNAVENTGVQVDGDADTASDSDDSSSDHDGTLSIEAESSLVPPPELPSSSGNIGVPDECVDHLLSVYSFLRSFSIPLFLSPFGLEDFVGSVNCSVQNSLLDAIHVALMRALRRCFENLSSDGSELASKCLRSLDWSLIDSLTWPIFVVQYLMMMGYTEGLQWKEFYSDALQRDYYDLSAGKKLKILQILCDDALDSAELRAEIDMREESIDSDSNGVPVAASEVGPRRVHPRYAKISASKDKGSMEKITEIPNTKSSFNSLGVEDGNGDECRLCGMDGILLCCDGCPSVYHARCIGVTRMSIPEGEWYCPECTINKIGPPITGGTSLRGAEFLGIDPCDQVFLGSCKHLLVVKTSMNSVQCIKYYHQKDILMVLQALHSSKQHVAMYTDLCKAIIQYWEIPEMGTKLGSETEDCGNLSSQGMVAANCPVSKSGYRSIPDDSIYMGSTFQAQAYLNCYTHGDFAASAAANLAILSSEENHAPKSKNTSDSHGKITSANIMFQVKAFSSAANRFFWPNFEKKLAEVPRERCAWCLACKAPVQSKKACLLNTAASNATKGTMKILAGIRPVKIGEGGSLHGIATYMMFMEESLRGLTVGPFKSMTSRKQWCKRAEQAQTRSAIKGLLLELEENIRVVAFSGDWIKPIDGWPAEYSGPQSTTVVGSSQKGGPGRRGRKPSAMPQVTTNDVQEIKKGFIWWRGGLLSRIIFQKGILPRAMVKKSARQGGSKKIHSINYTEGVEVPKRSRRLVWRAAVEMSKNTSQLALQIRYLDIHLRWSDLVRPEQNPLDGKAAEIEATAFRNACIYDKRIMESKIRYAVAFGNQKHLSSRVMKNVLEVEESQQDGTEKYWFLDSRVPLYLIKEYEEKMEKLPLPPAGKPENVLSKLQRKQLKDSRKDIFSYLTRRRDNLDMCRCASCRLDVFLGNAVKCSVCEGFCHVQCTSSSTMHMSEEMDFLLTCKRCNQAESTLQPIEKRHVSPTSPLSLQRPKEPQSAVNVLRGEKSNCSNRWPVPPSNGSLDRSIVERKQPATSSFSGFDPIKRSKSCNWGLIWKKKDSGDTGIDFRLTNILHKGNPNFASVECDLCRQPYNSNLMYICCETCKKWIHADAVELDESRVFELLGFKCCKCRRIRSPVCPHNNPERRAILESKKPSTRTLKPKTLEAVSSPETVSEPLFIEREPAKKELVCIKGNNPLAFSLSRVSNKHVTERIPERDSALVSEPGPPQKLAVVRRRYTNVEGDFVGSSSVNDNPSVHPSAPVVGAADNKSPSQSVEWDVSANTGVEEDGAMMFDYGHLNVEDMQFEPNTYFSFDELLETEDPSGNNVVVPCQKCSRTEPKPDRCCQICGLWMHSHCSPWVEDEEESAGSAWRCGNCREWR